MTAESSFAAPRLEHPIHWVVDDQVLAEHCARWRTLPMLAVDTEFMRSQTYYPLPALVQINDGQGNYLIDPLAISDFAPLRELFLNPQVIKVLHSCSEDLEVFQTLLNLVPEPIFDTQVAAAYCGYGFSLGFANLVQQVLDVSLPKDETRSDWLQRPLSQPQVLYAAIDVEYLLQIAEHLRERLQSLGRLEWLQEDGAKLIQLARSGQDPQQLYKRFKAIWRLSRQELAILRQLAIWREEVARKRNVPRNRVVKEQVLVSLAREKPNHLGQLRKYEGMTERIIRTDGQALLDVIQQAQATAPTDWPPLLPKPLSPQMSALMKRLKKHVQQQAEALGMAPEALIRKKDYEYLVRAAADARLKGETRVELPEGLQGWREAVVGERLLGVIEEELKAAGEPAETASTSVQEDIQTQLAPDGDGAAAEPSEKSAQTSILCDIYRSRRAADTYLYIARDQGLRVVPQPLLERLGKLDLALTLMLDEGRTLARADVQQVLQALRERGYFLQLPPQPQDYMQNINLHNNKLY